MSGCRPVIVKICGMTRQEDATAAVMAGADLLGFIFHPKSPRNVTPEFAASIDTGQAMRVGVFVNQSLEEIQDIMEKARLTLAQLSGDQDLEFCQALGRPRVMRVFWPERYATRAELETELDRFTSDCRFFLLDGGKSGGGHGKVQDFSFLAGLRSRRPWFLAGGLNPENLPQALAGCQPTGVDLNSGLESAPGVKDHERIREALSSVRVHSL